MARKSPGATADKKRHGLVPRHLPTRSRGLRSFEKVLHAAAKLIDRGGLESATTRRIALEAGLSIGAVYEYFPNKESIALRIRSDWMDRIWETAQSLHPERSGILDFHTYLNRSMEAAVRLYTEQPALLGVFSMIGAIPALREAERRHDERILQSVGSALRFFAGPGAGDADIEATVRCLQAMIHAILSECYVARSGDPTAMVPRLYTAVYALVVPLMLPRRFEAG